MHTLTAEQVKVYQLIKNFVEEIHETFKGKSVSPLTLFHRLMESVVVDSPQVKEETYNIVLKINGSFYNFLKGQHQYLCSSTLDLPKGSRIFYDTSERVYLDISSFIHRSEPEDKKVIKEHLLAIDQILHPDRDRTPLPEESREKSIIRNLMNSFQNSFEGLDPTADPSSMVMKLMTNGGIVEMINQVKTLTSDEKLDRKALLREVKSSLKEVFNSLEEEEPSTEGPPPLTIEGPSSSTSLPHTPASEDSPAPQ